MTLEGSGGASLSGEVEATVSFTPVSHSEAKSTVTPLPEIGQQFGDYRIVRRLGQGGMGVVYEVKHFPSERRVALKVLSHALDSTEHRRRFLREGRLAAAVNHPNSVYIFGTEEIDGSPAISMELVPGGTLQQRVKDHGPLPVTEAVDDILQIVAGLEAAQVVGVLHRDVKPANCFVDTDGRVKVGDFGLSISTTGRDESYLTAIGSILGTPAFASPEQLRGDELNVRSDIYSVGVTLYYLLTGRTPFAGDDLVKLLVTVLERPAQSPATYRREIPKGLCAAVLRCLAKDPQARFKDYAELRAALLPFTSTAPTPATVGRRALAGLVDFGVWWMFQAVIGITLMVLASGRSESLTPRPWIFAVVMFLLMILYYAVPEGLRGASVGKWICGLRVIGPERNVPGVARATGRAAIYLIVPALPVWVSQALALPVFLVDSKTTVLKLLLLTMGLTFSGYILQALLFYTMRRRNGFAAVHDLLTKTRVVRKFAIQARPVMAAGESPVPTAETLPLVGPYHLLETVEKTDAGEWLLAYDRRLLRKVWLHVVPAGTPPVAAEQQALGRVGRLRWITGRRSEQENWDAFEGSTGKPLLHLLDKPQPWSLVRHWLLDLATEIVAAEKDRTLPGVLSLDRVWITSDGRAKLLDFPAPGVSASFAPAEADGNAFLNQVARSALGGGEKLRVPLPVHARKFLDALPALPTAEIVAGALRPLLHNVSVVTRARRAALVMGCVALPLLVVVCSVVGTRAQRAWMSEPDVAEFQRLMSQRLVSQMKLPWLNDQPRPSDEAFMIYISSHYRHIITDPAVWQKVNERKLISGEGREEAEASLREYPHPAAEQVEQATREMKPFLDRVRETEAMETFQRQYWFVLVGGASWLYIVGVWAVLAAVLFRGGLVMLVGNVAVVRKDGLRASRVRILWRSLVAWSPLFLAPILLAMILPLYAKVIHAGGPAKVQSAAAPASAMPQRNTNAAASGKVSAATGSGEATESAATSAPYDDEVAKVLLFAMLPWALLAMSLVLAVTVWSLALPERGMQDRIAGTRLVPR